MDRYVGIHGPAGHVLVTLLNQSSEDSRADVSRTAGISTFQAILKNKSYCGPIAFPCSLAEAYLGMPVEVSFDISFDVEK